ncbi:MAG: hypothetical protein H0T79_12380, partial [Deltaproteobacteria bacterium]|nr:hypothetical protein [Deltaproteobacteria bacterium]
AAPTAVGLSLLVTRQSVRIGRWGAATVEELPRDLTLAAKLAPILAQHQAAHGDLEIAAMPDTTYGEVVQVIDAATTAGLVDWKLTEPAGLTARVTP